MAKPPKEPTLNASEITETLVNKTTRPVPWLKKFWDILVPFFRDTTTALNKGLTLQENFLCTVLDGEERPLLVQPSDVEVPVNLFVETTIRRPVLVFVVAEPVVEAGVPAEALLQVTPEWMPATQGTKAGVRLVRFRGLPLGRRYRLAVTVLGG